MPLLWRYLLRDFLKITLTSVGIVVAILLTMRLDEIAHFAGLGAPLLSLLFFTLYQIPYILPIALPLSCLIASLILIQRLSNTQELTALRASGFSIVAILSPLLLSAAFLSLANFWIISELATQSHFKTNLLKSELRSINPLLLLHNKHLMRLKGFYFETLGSSFVGESTTDVILALPNKHQNRLSLMIAQHLKTTPHIFIGEGVTLITSAANKNEEEFDHLLIENMQKSTTQIEDFSHLLQRKVWTINNDYLHLSVLLSRIKDQSQQLKALEISQGDRIQMKSLKYHLNRSYSEIIKRFSIAFAVFSFTLLGSAFGINLSRIRQTYKLYVVIGLTTFFLIAFFVAKGVDHHFWLSTTLYLLPHLLIIGTSLFVLKRMIKGIEA